MDLELETVEYFLSFVATKKFKYDVYLDHLILLELGKWSCPSKCHESDSTNLLLFYSLFICSKEQIKTSRIANAFKL